MQEFQKRGIDANQACDDVNYIDLEVSKDFLEKCQAIVSGQSYDPRVMIPLDIPNDELLQFMVAAHNADMTFNEFVERAVKKAIEDFEQDPESLTKIAKEIKKKTRKKSKK